MTDTSVKHQGARAGERMTDAADIAKAIRADIKTGRAIGDLPEGPWTVSVTCDRYSMGQSVDIEVRDYGFAERVEEEYEASPGYFITRQVRTPEATALHDALEAYRRAYLVDRSDSMTDYFDVTYAGHVHFESPRGREVRLAKAEARRAKKAAQQG